jgi:Putative metallopeptidase
MQTLSLDQSVAMIPDGASLMTGGFMPVEARTFADVHGLPAQRCFNVLCIAYGSAPDLYAGVMARGNLPPQRAENCRYEYRRFEFGSSTTTAVTRLVCSSTLEKAQYFL